MGVRRTALGWTAVAGLVLVLAACGGGGNTTTTTTSGGMSASDWATGVCSSFTTWKNSLTSIESDVTSNPSSSAIRKAGRDFEQATRTLTRSLKQLGPPATAQGEAAKQNLDALVTTLDNGMSKIDDALHSSGGLLSQITAITGTLSSMASELRLTGGNLKKLAPSGELQQAFQQSSACKPYVH